MFRHGGFIAIAVLAAGLSVSTSAEARIGWQGRAVQTAGNATCDADGQTVGSQVQNVSFLPSGLSDNGVISYLSFFFQRAAYSVRVSGPFAVGKSYASVKINSFGQSSTNSVGQIVQFSTSPAPVLATSRFVNMTVSITNFLGTVGCTATFEISLVRRL